MWSSARTTGVPAAEVRGELDAFDRTLAEHLEILDGIIRIERPAEHTTEDDVNAVLILCAWAHGEWLRIHPVPNGDGRTARTSSTRSRYVMGCSRSCGCARALARSRNGLRLERWNAIGKVRFRCSSGCTKQPSTDEQFC